MSKPDFERLLIEAVDEGLSSLGDSSRQAIYSYLESLFNIKREEIPSKIKAFEDTLESIFGAGASFLEILVMQRLYGKTGASFKWHVSKDVTFSEYVSTSKSVFLKKAETSTAIVVLADSNQAMVET